MGSVDVDISENGLATIEKAFVDLYYAVTRDEYQLLPLNHLFADKLTTIGCETIGVQNSRMDEQVIQFKLHFRN